MGRPLVLMLNKDFVQMLEMPFDFSPNANVMRICTGVRKCIKHIQ